MNRNIPSIRILRLAWLALGGAFLLGAALVASAADTPAWIAKSNTHSQLLLDVICKFSPEFASSTGIPGYDDKVADLSAGARERTRVATLGARDELARRLLAETDALV